MNFYMCQTAEGPRLAGTQADAKALDKGFKEHVVPDDKAGRMAYVNALLAQTHGTVPAKLAADIIETAIAHVEAAPVIDEPKAAPVSTTGNRPMSEIDNILLRTGVEGAIWDMGVDDLRKLEEVINERKKELLSPPVTRERVRVSNAVQRVAPPPRVRTRTEV